MNDLNFNGRTSLIRSGEMQGFYIRIICDTADTGGCYVLYSRDFNDPAAEGYDEWYPSASDAEQALRQLSVTWNNET